MTEAQQKIIDALKNDRFVSAHSLSRLTNLPLYEVFEQLPVLESDKKVRYIPFKNHEGSEEKAYYLASN